MRDRTPSVVAVTTASARRDATPSRPRRRLAPLDRRAELVDAAIRVLRSGRDEGNWVAAVTREAGAAKGTFYLYFPSWEEMLLTVRERLLDASTVLIRDALASPEPVDWWGILEDGCARFIDAVREFDRQHALIFHTGVPEGSTQASSPSVALLAALIERGVAAGCFGTVDITAASRLLLAVVHAAADAVLAGGERDRWIAASLALARGYLAAPDVRKAHSAAAAPATRRR
jgi:AcrR family transcriptional regulator